MRGIKSIFFKSNIDPEFLRLLHHLIMNEKWLFVFQKSEPHTLYKLHAEAKNKADVQELLRQMEADCVKELDEVISNAGEDLSEFDELFKDCVETEVKFYRQNLRRNMLFLSFEKNFKSKHGLWAAAYETRILCTG